MENTEPQEVPATIETPVAIIITPQVTPKVGVIERVTNVMRANSIIDQLRQDNTQLTTQLAEAQNAFANLQNMSHDQQALVTAHNTAIEKMKNDYEAKVNELTLKAELTQEKVSAQAVEQLAAAGITANKIETQVAPIKTAYEVFKELVGPAQQQYFEKNKSEIMKSRPMVK
jgi:uncharacterized protein YeeX (DUF496 family)